MRHELVLHFPECLVLSMTVPPPQQGIHLTDSWAHQDSTTKWNFAKIDLHPVFQQEALAAWSFKQPSSTSGKLVRSRHLGAGTS